MAKKFGTTWWGEQWLNSLSHIDYSNRLPRGVRYARNGSVTSIEIKGGKISARVAGSRPTPYRETIEIPQFDRAKMAAFVHNLTVQPMILASLMQRKLEPEVLTIAQKIGLKVFPTSWKDFDMKCSCPDWAVPCKHLAAVIYKVSEEIDNNPFIVFELHGLDLLSELQKRGFISAEESKDLNPIDIKNLMHKSLSDDLKEWRNVEVDFSRLPQIGSDLIEILADNPPFSTDGDFKKIYTRQIGIVGKAVAKEFDAIGEGDGNIDLFGHGAEVSFKINKTYDTEVTLTMPDGDKISLSFDEFTERLSHVDASSYLTSQPWVETTHKLWLLAANLLSRRDIVPQIVDIGKGFRILWQPATIHSDIKQIVGRITGCVPNLVSLPNGKRLENSGEWLLWNMLNVMVAKFGRTKNSESQLFDLFFADIPQAFSGIGQREIAGGIKAWTDKFFMLADDRCRFEMQVDDNDSKFSVKVLVRIKADEASLPQRVELTDIFNNLSLKPHMLGIMTRLSALSDYMPELHDYLLRKGEIPMTFNSSTFVPFLFRTLPLMRLLGVEIALPNSLHELITPKVSVKVDKNEARAAKSHVRLDELLTFSWEIALGDTLVSPDEFRDIMRKAGELIKFKGRYIYATPEELEKIRKELSKEGKLSSQEILAIALAESYKDAPVKLTDACRELLKQLRDMPHAQIPTGLQAELRPYQKNGYEWMLHNLSLGFGAIIADDMGLGKTLQVIAVLLSLKESDRLSKRKALVVVPTGLLTNWQKECARFAPSLSTAIYHGTARSLDKFEADIMLTSYGVVRSDYQKLRKLKWEIIIVDEAQNIKNPASAQTKAINSINAVSHIAMSGTPVENRLSEYWSIMNFANKGLLGSLKEFNSLYGRPIQIEGNQDATQRFKAMTAPFMLRRLKSDKSIISDLPDKIERDEFAFLTPAQSALYQQTLNEAMKEIESIEGTDNASLFKREGLVLQMILALKQICNHPSQFLKNNQAEAELSGKATMLLDLVSAIVANGEKVLIFTQFKTMGDLIAKMLDVINIPSMFYHGGCTVKKRNEMIERFQNQRSAQVFILSLKAAGTGLNLTAATNVIHFDLWWNPAVEAQATDRAYRIGQHRNVQVYRFITKGTFEEKINEMIQDKKKLADLTVGTGEKWLATMSDSELRSIFTLNSNQSL